MASLPAQVDLSPLPIRTRPALRFAQLLGGLAAYGISMGLMVRAEIGLSPWDALHEGLSQRLNWSFGAVTALTGVLVMLAWLPLRQRPGIGTVANVVVIAFAVDFTLAMTPQLSSLPARLALMVFAIALNGLATAVYVGARLGPGPRDGLMTGLHARTGWSLRVVRTTIEVCVLAVGWVLGGTVGVGTVLYATSIGPLTQLFLKFAVVREKKDLCP
ncbi:hypothetical protein [Saccharopolyspora sp. NPDC002686]|uniref:membrane protein YczE n=1 Tax=Saccharopolyspora sp. NPDC002686 TaxID=3154541 RepID=UPI00332FC3C5